MAAATPMPLVFLTLLLVSPSRKGSWRAATQAHLRAVRCTVTGIQQCFHQLYLPLMKKIKGILSGVDEVCVAVSTTELVVWRVLRSVRRVGGCHKR
jgi:hypothetical protein